MTDNEIDLPLNISVLSSRAYNALTGLIEVSTQSKEESGWRNYFTGPIKTRADLKREIILGNVAKARHVGPAVLEELARLVGLNLREIKGKRLCPKCGTLV